MQKEITNNQIASSPTSHLYYRTQKWTTDTIYNALKRNCFNLAFLIYTVYAESCMETLFSCI